MFQKNVPQKCFTTFVDGTTVYCSNSIGMVFNINKETLKYNRAHALNQHGDPNAVYDTLFVATGTCEKF